MKKIFSFIGHTLLGVGILYLMDTILVAVGMSDVSAIVIMLIAAVAVGQSVKWLLTIRWDEE